MKKNLAEKCSTWLWVDKRPAGPRAVVHVGYGDRPANTAAHVWVGGCAGSWNTASGGTDAKGYFQHLSEMSLDL